VSADNFAPAQDARRFENWEFAYSLVLGLGEAARYALAVGVDYGGKRARELAATLRGKLSGLRGIRVLDRGSQLAAIVTIAVTGWDATELSRLLRTRGINSSASLRAYAVIDMDEKRAASALRLSPHYYNTEEEIDRVVEQLKAVTLKGSTVS
jgi:selenocysteine lyase/cysteine desulfurase